MVDRWLTIVKQMHTLFSTFADEPGLTRTGGNEAATEHTGKPDLQASLGRLGMLLEDLQHKGCPVFHDQWPLL
jgi:hypothetical protein